jgi:hypothetical protein
MKGLRREFPNFLRIKEDVFYKVSFRRNITDCYGWCDSGKQEIVIATGLPPKERIITFVHEFLHAIEFEHNIKIPHKLIHQLEAPLAYLLTENTNLQWVEWK